MPRPASSPNPSSHRGMARQQSGPRGKGAGGGPRGAWPSQDVAREPLPAAVTAGLACTDPKTHGLERAPSPGRRPTLTGHAPGQGRAEPEAGVQIDADPSAATRQWRPWEPRAPPPILAARARASAAARAQGPPVLLGSRGRRRVGPSGTLPRGARAGSAVGEGLPARSCFIAVLSCEALGVPRSRAPNQRLRPSEP